VPHPYWGLGIASRFGRLRVRGRDSVSGCFEDILIRQLPQSFEFQDMSIIAQHGDDWGGMRAFSRIYVRAMIEITR
jgi:hypothetical protein